MIIVKLQGGLGNQMFQYATGRQLSVLYDTKLKLDLSFLLDRSLKEDFTFRDFELGKLNIVAEFVKLKDVQFFLKEDFISRLKKRFGRFQLFKEENFSFQQEIFSKGKSIYLDGYWQSERYFINIREKLLSEFTPDRGTLSKLNENPVLKNFREQILNNQSVSVHFRRGDYISNKVTNSYHGTCSYQYYNDAIGLIKQKTGKPHYFLFSDEPEFLTSLDFIKEIPSTTVTSNDPHLDMHLMSLCKHNIIANSSFSWWGAWLNQNPDKIVIAPERWFAKDELNLQTKDLVPSKWIRI